MQHCIRPSRVDSALEVRTGDEWVLYGRHGGVAAQLNESGRSIWELCDGERTLFEIVETLRDTYACDDEAELFVHVTAALQRLQGLGLLETRCGERLERAPIKFVVGIEDKTYLRWQLAILCESLIGQLPNGWEILVVVCNDHQPISEELRHILDAYGVRHFTGANHPVRENMDFATGPDWYLILNKIEALRAVGEALEDDDVVCLIDTDMFLFRELDPSIFPDGNALCANWIISQERFFAEACGGGPGLVDLQGLLGAIGCTDEFRPGGVTIFLDGKTAKSAKVVNDCFRFSQILYLLGKVGDLPEVWVAEMPSYALSLTANGVPYEVIDEGNEAFVIAKPESIPAGSFYHYYADFQKGDLEGAFWGSTWSKQQFRDIDFLSVEIEVFAEKAVTDHERYFFELALRAQRRLGLTRVQAHV